MKLLIVEDVPSMAKMAKFIATSAGHDCDIAKTPSEALEKLLNTQYDGILMDFGLPEMTGLELTRIIRDDGFSKPIIGLTANPDRFSQEVMLKAGLNSCLSKPLQAADLLLFDIDVSCGWVENGRQNDGKLDAR